jgi:cytochrome P450
MDEIRHLKERRMLLPPFHGDRMRACEGMIEEEAVRAMASWPENTEFATLPAFKADHPEGHPARRSAAARSPTSCSPCSSPATTRPPPRWRGRSTRLRRDPAVVRRLTEEADTSSSTLRTATIFEVQDHRSVIAGITQTFAAWRESASA